MLFTLKFTNLIFQIFRVITDGGSNMLASDFGIQLPSWQSDSTVPIVTENSTRALPESDFEQDEAIEIEFTIDDNGETVPLWEIVVEPAEELREAAAEDRNVLFEQEDLEQELQDTIFSLSKATQTAVSNKSEYSLSSSLRSTCVAHILQLVIKDGIKAMAVS
jgi:hypothetical protein